MEQIIGIIAAILAAALVIFTVIYNVRKKKSGKGCCSGDCSHCKGCHPADDKKSCGNSRISYKILSLKQRRARKGCVFVSRKD